MKFYRDTSKSSFYWQKLKLNKSTCAYIKIGYFIIFFKNGLRHNSKNASYFEFRYKEFWSNGKKYGYEYNFDKKTWRRFVKMQVFL
jgi:hypothetical protein